MAVNTTQFPSRGVHPRSATTRRSSAPRPTDDEILGLVTAVPRPAAGNTDAATAPAQMPASAQAVGSSANAAETGGASANAATQPDASDASGQSGISSELAQILDSNPQLRDAWNASQQFRSVFPTPAAAQDAKNQLDELDNLFFSAQPGDQAALAARIHDLSPGAFHALAQAMQAHSAKIAAANAAQPTSAATNQPAASSSPAAPSTAVSSSAAAAPSNSASAQAPAATKVAAPAPASAPSSKQMPAPASTQPALAQAADPRRAAQLAFFHSANSAAVHQVIGAIEGQVNHLLPSGVSAATKTRIVGEIYRDLGSVLSANRQLGQQLRDAFRSGAGDAAHQQAIVALVTGRAKQALPSIARRVIGEWTHGVVSANNERLSRQETAAKRVDVSGGGSSDGVKRKPLSPRDVDYKRLSDADILNL
jgi:hypothetical protein